MENGHLYRFRVLTRVLTPPRGGPSGFSFYTPCSLLTFNLPFRFDGTLYLLPSDGLNLRLYDYVHTVHSFVKVRYKKDTFSRPRARPRKAGRKRQIPSFWKKTRIRLPVLSG